MVRGHMPKQLVSLVAFALMFTGCAHVAAKAEQVEACDSSPHLQDEKSAQLIKIVNEDQADRSGPYDSIDWKKVNPRDLARRIEVARIFAEGCFKTASDYGSAALIFQHGT